MSNDILLEIWKNIHTGEIEVHTTLNNYAACYDTWELIARKTFIYTEGEGLDS